MDSLKVSVSGVRGVVGQTFTPAIAASFGKAFGAFVGRGRVVVGRDTRPSGLMIEEAVIAGLLSVGCTPVRVGVTPTPSILYATKGMGARGGIAITASHNPMEWNALKFVNRKGLFLDAVHVEELLDFYHQRSFPLVPESGIQQVLDQEGVVQEHFKRIFRFTDLTCIREAKFKVAVDCCNGVGGLFSVPFLEELGCQVVPLHQNPSGLFERGPEPTPANIQRLCEVVRSEGCDLGFAQDPDGDRLAVVDETGTAIGEDMTVALAVLQILKKRKGPVVTNLTISKRVEDMVLQCGGEMVLTPTGEINVTAEMLRRDAVLGGENSGGVILPHIHPCRDSFGGMAIVLELLATQKRSLSSIVSDFSRYALRRKKIQVQPRQAPIILRQFRKHFAHEKLNLEDGVYVDFGDRWLHVRRSNTEPILRLTVEAPTEETARTMEHEAQEIIFRVMEGG